MAYDPGQDYNPGLGTLTKKSVSDVAPGQWGTAYSGALLGSGPQGASLGFQGPVSGFYQGTGDSGGDMSLNPEYQKFLTDNGIDVRQQYTGEFNGNNYNLQGFKGDAKVGDQQTYHNSNDEAFWDSAMVLGLIGGAGVAGAGAGAGAEGATAVGGSGGLSSADLAALHSAEGYGATSAADAGYAGLGATTSGGAAGLSSADVAALPGAYGSAPAYAGPGSAGAGAAGEGAAAPGSSLGQNLKDLYSYYKDAKTVGGMLGGQQGGAGGVGGQGGYQMSAGDRFRQQLAAQALRDQADQRAPQTMPGYVPGG